MERILIGPDCEILIGHDLPDPLLPEAASRRRTPVLTQPGASRVAQRVAAKLQREGYQTALHVMPDREGAKTLAAVEEAYHWLASLEVGRADTLVAVGGGALCDAAGFVAASWMRGIEVIHVPTTLLAAVDAAVGGKTALNLGGKNLIGLFWHPRRVVIDLSVLADLPEELLREGAAEVIKAGLLADRAVVDAYLRSGWKVDLAEVVPRAVRVKAAIVEEDFTERGRRALLNLGHTIGHAVEFTTGLSHGFSVSIGLVAAAAISEHRLGFPDADVVSDTLTATGLPTSAPTVERSALFHQIGLDKKRSAEGIRMVLLAGLEQPVLQTVEESDVQRGLQAVGL